MSWLRRSTRLLSIALIAVLVLELIPLQAGAAAVSAADSMLQQARSWAAAELASKQNSAATASTPQSPELAGTTVLPGQEKATVARLPKPQQHPEPSVVLVATSESSEAV
ncbi:MAG: hypothetical protein HYX87_04450 [Chloroflexi bacterium]|nr:hypothetical protein [Chloroflexota bacterium]